MGYENTGETPWSFCDSGRFFIVCTNFGLKLREAVWQRICLIGCTHFGENYLLLLFETIRISKTIFFQSFSAVFSYFWPYAFWYGELNHLLTFEELEKDML